MQNQSKILKWSVIVGIIIVLNLFFNYALSLVYAEPEWDAYCPQTQVVTVPRTQDECLAQGGQWSENTYYNPSSQNYGEISKPRVAGVDEPAGFCDLQFTCRQEFEDARKNYERNVFVVLVVLGALSVLGGNILKGNEVISSGLALGGVLSFIVASMRYWSSANDLFRVIILAIALGLLIWIAWKKFSNRQ